MRPLVTASLISLTVLSTSVLAEELLGDPAAGHRLAEDVCATCHVISASNLPITEVDAPAFPDLANEPRVTALSLRVFLQTPHERMPDLHLGPDETDNVIAYILSLKR
jgi:mono/diheme cytochrome c family protein